MKTFPKYDWGGSKPNLWNPSQNPIDHRFLGHGSATTHNPNHHEWINYDKLHITTSYWYYICSVHLMFILPVHDLMVIPKKKRGRPRRPGRRWDDGTPCLGHVDGDFWQRLGSGLWLGFDDFTTYRTYRNTSGSSQWRILGTKHWKDFNSAKRDLASDGNGPVRLAGKKGDIKPLHSSDKQGVHWLDKIVIPIFTLQQCAVF